MPSHRALRAFDVLTEQDIADMQALARHVNAVAMTSASTAADHLRVINAMAWSWKKSVEGAHRALQEIETACQRVTET